MLKAKTLNADVFGIFATWKDRYITTEVVNKFADAMKAAGKTLILKNYDADHGFANPSNPIMIRPRILMRGRIRSIFLKQDWSNKIESDDLFVTF